MGDGLGHGPGRRRRAQDPRAGLCLSGARRLWGAAGRLRPAGACDRRPRAPGRWLAGWPPRWLPWCWGWCWRGGRRLRRARSPGRLGRWPAGTAPSGSRSPPPMSSGRWRARSTCSPTGCRPRTGCGSSSPPRSPTSCAPRWRSCAPRSRPSRTASPKPTPRRWRHCMRRSCGPVGSSAARTAVGAHHAQQDADGGGLPGAVGAEKAMHFAGPDAQVQAVQRAGAAKALTQARHHDQVIHLRGGHGGAPSGFGGA